MLVLVLSAGDTLSKRAMMIFIHAWLSEFRFSYSRNSCQTPVGRTYLYMNVRPGQDGHLPGQDVSPNQSTRYAMDGWPMTDGHGELLPRENLQQG
jgi:hypothetical protein